MSRIIILEGVDGAGKTTLAQYLTREPFNGRRLLHFDRNKGLEKTVGRTYVEAMMPALSGLQDIVMDRCWLSEAPYAAAYWNNDDRLMEAGRRILERIAMRASATVIMADPGWETVRGNYQRDKALEMLDDETQLKFVHSAYRQMNTAIPVIKYDYSYHTFDDVKKALAHRHSWPHLTPGSAGNLNANILLVTGPESRQTDVDPLMRFPMSSFAKDGDSIWLANHLEAHGIYEKHLVWCGHKDIAEFKANADWAGFYNPSKSRIYALGAEAAEACRAAGLGNTFSEVLDPSRHRTAKVGDCIIPESPQ